MKVSCNVIKDIMPLYIEDLASEDSIQLIEEHIKTCDACKEELEQMKKGQIPTEEKEKSDHSLQSVKKNIKKKRKKAVIFFSLAVFVVMLTAFSYVVSPRYIPYEESGMKVETRENGELAVRFSDKVTSVHVEEGYWEPSPESNVKEITAWTSLWDQYLKKSSSELTLPADTDRIVFDDYADHGNMKVAYAKAGEESTGGGMVLRRNLLKVYAMLTVILTVILAIVCILVRKHRKLFQIAWKMLMAPAAYSISSLLQFRNLSSYELPTTLCVILLCGCAIYGILLLGVEMIRDR